MNTHPELDPEFESLGNHEAIELSHLVGAARDCVAQMAACLDREHDALRAGEIEVLASEVERKQRLTEELRGHEAAMLPLLSRLRQSESSPHRLRPALQPDVDLENAVTGLFTDIADCARRNQDNGTLAIVSARHASRALDLIEGLTDGEREPVYTRKILDSQTHAASDTGGLVRVRA